MKVLHHLFQIGRIAFFFFALVPVMLLACQNNENLPEKKELKLMTFHVKSSAFTDGGFIPEKYTCDGEDISPPLSWTLLPPNTKSIAIICDDPDAPGGTWVHWVLYGLAPNAPGLPEGISNRKVLPNGTKQGVNDFHKIGYGGPCPPKGAPHRYFFKVYALDEMIALDTGVSKKELLKAIEQHIIAKGQLMGKYKR